METPTPTDTIEANKKEAERLAKLAQDLLSVKVDESRVRSLAANIRYATLTETLLMLAKVSEVEGDPKGAVLLRGYAKDYANYEATLIKR